MAKLSYQEIKIRAVELSMRLRRHKKLKLLSRIRSLGVKEAIERTEARRKNIN